MGEWTVDVNEKDFEQDVLERSYSVPVVLDFWAPWCGPCRAIGPVLEKLADEQAGKFVLAKVNVDENPALAQSFQISSIPAVKAVKEGAIANEFLGALPEPAIREFVEGLIPSEADSLAQQGQDLQEQGKDQGAESLYRAALSKDERQPKALLGLARLLAGKEEHADALALLGRIPPNAREHDAAQQLAAQIRVKQTGANAGEEAAYREKMRPTRMTWSRFEQPKFWFDTLLRILGDCKERALKQTGANAGEEAAYREKIEAPDPKRLDLVCPIGELAQILARLAHAMCRVKDGFSVSPPWRRTRKARFLGLARRRIDNAILNYKRTGEACPLHGSSFCCRLPAKTAYLNLRLMRR